MARLAYEVKQGATAPALVERLRDDAGKYVGVHGATVYFRFRDWAGARAVLGGQCVNLDSGSDDTKGKVQYNWGTLDTSVPGLYRAEFKIIYAAGTPQQTVAYVPADGYRTLEVVASLG